MSMPPPVCGHFTEPALDVLSYLEPRRDRFIPYYFNLLLVPAIVWLMLTKRRMLRRLTDIVAAIVLVYTACYKAHILAHTNWVDICTAWSADSGQSKYFLQYCVAGWLASTVLDFKTCLLVLKLPDKPRPRRFRADQRRVVAFVVYLFLNACAVVAKYMHSDYHVFSLLTSDLWMVGYFVLAALARAITLGLQACVFSRGLVTQGWTFLPENDPRRRIMTRTWAFNIVMPLHTLLCIVYHRSTIDLVFMCIHLVYQVVVLWWSVNNSVLDLRNILEHSKTGLNRVRHHTIPVLQWIGHILMVSAHTVRDRVAEIVGIVGVIPARDQVRVPHNNRAGTNGFLVAEEETAHHNNNHAELVLPGSLPYWEKVAPPGPVELGVHSMQISGMILPLIAANFNKPALWNAPVPAAPIGRIARNPIQDEDFDLDDPDQLPLPTFHVSCEEARGCHGDCEPVLGAGLIPETISREDGTVVVHGRLT